MRKMMIESIDKTLRESTEKFNSLQEFSEQVLIDYILLLSKHSIIIDYTKIKETKEELLLEITEITQKKMYGFYDINEYKEFLTKKNC